MTDATRPAGVLPNIVSAALVIIGNEILSGRTQDANLAYLAVKLNAAGIRLREVRVIPDDRAGIIATINELRKQHNYLFTTGGIGPTHDDITSEAVAAAFERPLVRHPAAEALLTAHYGADKLTPARLKMAEVPEGASLIENPVSRAPGFRIANVFVLAGVPSVMRAMVDGLIGGLTGGAPVLSRTVAGEVAEGVIAADLAAVQGDFPDVEIGSYPWFRQGRYGTSLVARGVDAGELERVAAALAALVTRHGAVPQLQEAGQEAG